MKIYRDDPNLPYKTTKLKALHTKSEIDGLFAKWGVKDVFWHWDPDHNDVFVLFKIVEEIEGVPLQVSAKVEAPPIWNHKTRSRAESVNWDISMRVMYWFIKSHLEAAYLLQSSNPPAQNSASNFEDRYWKEKGNMNWLLESKCQYSNSDYRQYCDYDYEDYHCKNSYHKGF